MRGALLAAILLASCGPPPSREEQAIQVAYGVARDRFRYSQDIRKLPPRVEDLGDRWRIHFQPPAQMTGGDPMVDIRKADLLVLSSISGQ
jgi:hypothetical protein